MNKSDMDRKRLEEELRQSECKYENVVSTTSDAIMIFDAETRRFVEVNPACERLYGYSREEFLAMSHNDITAEPERSEQSIQKALKGELSSIPLRYHMKKDGTIFPVEISASKFLQNGRQVMCGVIRDITDRLSVEEELKKSEEKYRILFESSREGIITSDPEGRIVSANPAALSMLGYQCPEEMVGRFASEFYVEPERRKAIYDVLFEKGHYVNFEEILKKRDGTPIYCLCNVTLHRDEKGNFATASGVFLDITKLKNAEEALRESQKRLEEQNILLETKNIALSEVIAQVKKEKERVENEILANADQLIVPVISRLKKSSVSLERRLLDLLEENLRDLTSTFGKKISRKKHRLTPREIEICNMIRNGLSSKEIANIWNISYRTVETHRKNIRKKLGIANENINLVTYLTEQL